MEEQNIAIRLKVFIDSCGFSHSQFADKCGIPRPTLSQILSGRNKKVSDVIVGQVHRAFPELSIVWLLFGEGTMLNHVSNDGDSGSESASSVSTDKGVSTSDIGGLRNDDKFTTVNAVRDADSLFSSVNDSDFSGNRAANEIFSNLRALNITPETFQHTKDQLVEAENKIKELQLQIDRMRQNPRSVTHITIYYDDSTFETFTPKQ